MNPLLHMLKELELAMVLGKYRMQLMDEGFSREEALAIATNLQYTIIMAGTQNKEVNVWPQFNQNVKQ